MTNAQAVATPAGAPSGLSTPFGWFSFNITGLTTGATVTLTYVVPAGNTPTGYEKCVSGTCAALAGTTVSGTTLTVSLTDGGSGDADGTRNGVITDPGAIVTASGSGSSYTIGGTVSGLSGTGLVLQVNGAGNLAVGANGAITFPLFYATGTAYAVTVLTQPSAPAQTCTVTSGSGTLGSANVTNVAVACVTNSYSVGGTVTGLAGTGLVLQNNAGNDLAVSAGGTFTFAGTIASGSAYAVTVKTQPLNPKQTCTVSNGSGSVGATAVTNVAVACLTSPARFAYVANNGSNNVSAYSINASTGALTPLSSPAAPTYAAGTNPWAITADPAGKFLYVTNDNGSNVSAYAINATTGALTSVGTFATGQLPECAAVDPTGKFLYIGQGLNNISAFSINANTGALLAIGAATTLTGGPNSCVVDASGRYLFVTSFTIGTGSGTLGKVTAFSINGTTGALSLVGPATTTGLAMGIALTPSASYLYTTADPSGMGTTMNFAGFSVSSATGSLTALSGLPTQIQGNTNGAIGTLGVEPGGRFLYLATLSGYNTGTYGVAAYRIGAGGALTLSSSNSIFASVSAFDPTGSYMYAATGASTVGVFSINSSNGALTQVGTSVAAGTTPVSIAVVSP